MWNRIMTFLLWLRSYTVWEPGAISPFEGEWEYRNLRRVYLPLIDLAFVYSGIMGIIQGLPSLTQFFPDPFIDIVSAGFALSALAALFAVVLNKTKIESAAKVVLLGLLSAYAGALIVLTQDGDTNRGFITGIVAAAVFFISFRLSVLGTELKIVRGKGKKK